MTDALYAVLAAVIWQNIVVTGLLGLTPFLAERGASYARSATVGLCATVVMTIAVLVTALLEAFILDAAGATPAVLLVFAGVLLVLGAGGALFGGLSGDGDNTPRWRALLPEALLDAGLIGGAIVAMGMGESVGALTVEAVAAGLGFTAVLLIMEGIRERLVWLRPSGWVAGIPIQLITLGILALILSGFEGI